MVWHCKKKTGQRVSKCAGKRRYATKLVLEENLYKQRICGKDAQSPLVKEGIKTAREVLTRAASGVDDHSSGSEGGTSTGKKRSHGVSESCMCEERVQHCSSMEDLSEAMQAVMLGGGQD